MINKFRRILIRIGKVLPFIICFVVLLNYIECIVALLLNNYIIYDNVVILYTNFSFIINTFVEYDIQILIVLCVISIAIETCIYNKLACGYLGVNLAEKSYFDFELEPTTIYIICLANILVAGYLTIKGIMLYKSF